MDPWSRLERACLDRHGVADVRLAKAHGVTPNRFYVRTRREGWACPAPGVRVHPDAPASVQQRLLVVCRSSSHPAAASAQTALWLHGLSHFPPDLPSVVGVHASRCPALPGILVRRARWLTPADIVAVDAVPTLAPPAMVISLLSVLDEERRWAVLIDVVYRGLADAEVVAARLEAVGPLPGRRGTLLACRDLARRRVESIFNAEVVEELARLGYEPERSSRWIPTPSGRGLMGDIPLPRFKVVVEPDGDGFHRTREQRRRDRRREAEFATIDWVRVPVDWRDWHLDRARVLEMIDLAIAAQVRRGVTPATPA